MIRLYKIYHKYEFSDVVTALVVYGEGVFIGIRDIASEGTYQWIDGDTSTVNELKFSRNEPNNAGGNEDCLELFDYNALNDVTCTDARRALCERLLD